MRTLLILGLLSGVALGQTAAEVRRVTFEGNGNVESEDLREAARRDIRRFRSNGDEAAAEDAAFEMERHYRDQGYALATVTAELGGAGVVFRIEEGPRVFLGEVVVEGSEAGDASSLAAFVRVPGTGLFGSAVFGSRLFVRSRLKAAAGKMRSWLRQQGYLDAEVRGPEVTIVTPTDPTRDELPQEFEVRALFRVRDGPRAYLDRVRFDQGPGYRLEREERRLIRESVGEPYSPFTRYDLESIAYRFFGRRGFPFAEITVEESFLELEDRVSVELLIGIRSGPRAKIGRLDIAGNVRSRDHVIRRELEFGPGDIFDSDLVLESQRRLFRTDRLHQVNIDLVRPDREPDMEADDVTVDVEVSVEEKDFRRFETSVGFGTWELLRGSLAARWSNLDGAYRSFATELSGSFRGTRFSATYTEPWVFGLRLEGEAEAAIQTEERPTFRFDRQSFDVSFSEELTGRLDGFFGWGYTRTDVTDVDGDVPEEFENTTNISSLRAGLRWDARNSPWAPSKGTLLSGRGEFAHEGLASEIDFVRARVEAVQIFPIGEDEELKIVGHAAFGAIVPFGPTEAIPIQERFFLGGGQSVRSFTEDDLGPRLREEKTGERTDAAAGGEFSTLLNLELRFRIHGDLEGAIFGDAGNITEDFSDVDGTGFRYGVGAGLRYITPIGPIRVDFGVNPAPRPFEDRWAVALAIGYPF